MIRRPLLAACALLGAVTLTSCATFDQNRNAATVNDHELSQDQLGDMLESDLAGGLLQTSPVNGSIDGDAARSLLSSWIVVNALSDEGIGASGDRAATEQNFVDQAGDSWVSAPQVMKDFAIDYQIVLSELQTAGKTPEELQALLGAADITVDPRYGFWNDDAFAVSAFG